MGSSTNQQFNSGATDDAVAISGSAGVTTARDAEVVLGQGATIKTNNGIEGSNLSNSTVTIGETGLGSLFASTIRDITERNTASLESIIRGTDHAIPQPGGSLPPPTSSTPDATTPDPGDGEETSLPKLLMKYWWIPAGLLAFSVFRR